VSRRGLARAGLLVSGAFLVSRLLGWVRVAIFATTLGLGRDLDVFYAAFRLPDLMFQLVAAGALNSALIPVISELLHRDSEARAWRVVSTIANLMLVGLLLLAVVMFVAAPTLIPVIAPGFDPDQMDRAVGLTRIMVLSPMFLAMGTVATSVLNARGRFTASVLAPILYNLGMIGGALLLYPALGISGLAIGVVIGSACHLLVQVRPLALEGFAYRARISVSDPAARKALVLMAPRAFGLGAVQVTLVVLTSQASTMAAGSVAALNVAFTLLQIPLGVISMALGTVVLPALSKALATGARDEFVYVLRRSIRLLLFVMLPIAGMGMVQRHGVVDLLFGYGRFDAAAVTVTADTLLFFLVGLTAHGEIAILAPAFYADQDTRTPVTIAVTGTVITVILAILLAAPMGLAGLALSVAIGAWFEALVMVAILARRWPALGVRSLAGALAAAVAAAVAASATSAVVWVNVAGLAAGPARLSLLLRLVVTTGAGGLVFVGASRLLRIPELATITSVVADLVRRRR
jgi:putative peptidoglycan lipid II flippase